MSKIAVFTTKRNSNLLAQLKLLYQYRFGTIDSIDCYDLMSISSQICQDNNFFFKKVIITDHPFYTFFDDLTDKYDFIIFTADFPLYNSDATQYLISQACKKISKCENILFDYKHKNILQKFGYIVEENTYGLSNSNFVNLHSIPSFRKLDTIYNLIKNNNLKEQFPIEDNEISYSYIGSYYKTGSLINILNHYNLINRMFNVLDLGSGLCLVALELFLQFHKEVNRLSIDCVDVEYSNYINKLISSHFSFIPEDNFQFFNSNMINFQFQKKYDLIYLIGSLLYVPRTEVPIILNKIIDNLNPGGLLCIHENIKNPNYTRDYHQMFEASELENYLKEFGDISYFHGKTGQHIKEKIEPNKTFFRVIQK
jgi:hypothetical protein